VNPAVSSLPPATPSACSMGAASVSRQRKPMPDRSIFMSASCCTCVTRGASPPPWPTVEAMAATSASTRGSRCSIGAARSWRRHRKAVAATQRSCRTFSLPHRQSGQCLIEKGYPRHGGDRLTRYRHHWRYHGPAGVVSRCGSGLKRAVRSARSQSSLVVGRGGLPVEPGTSYLPAFYMDMVRKYASAALNTN
jgi:hypothetical protein